MSTKYAKISSVLLLLRNQRGDFLKSWASDVQTCGANPDWIKILDQSLRDTSEYHPDLHQIVDSLRTGDNLTVDQGLTLWNFPDLNIIGQLAYLAKQARFGDESTLIPTCMSIKPTFAHLLVSSAHFVEENVQKMPMHFLSKNIWIELIHIKIGLMRSIP